MLAAFGLSVLGGTLMTDRTVASCRDYCSVPGPLQSVQRAELWGVILALQASRGAHLGVDNLNVVRHVGRYLLCLIDRMLQLRGFDTVKVSKVTGHADEGMVLDGRVRVWIVWATMLLMKLLNLVGGGFLFMSLMLVVIWLGFAIVGILLFVIFIVFVLLLLGLLLIMMMAVVLRRTLWFFA